VKRSQLWQSRRSLPPPSDVDLHGNFDGVVDLDPEIPHRALDLAVAEEKLHGTEVSSLAVNEDCFRSAQRMRPELERVKTDARHPITDLRTMNASVSSGASLLKVAGSNFKSTVSAAERRAAANAIITCTR
jgi:hypothetical protein